ncbi:MAG: hypothetical protein EBS53_00885 [Bacteroidetes bacterium]|nr:hypothetical protein [Bacteroidota bacterium]
MAIGAANRQQMNPAQFVSQVNADGLFRPGDYSRPENYMGNVNTTEYARLVQDAMQKQAAFEAAYQQQQDDLGWNIVNNIQATLSKGAVTAGQMENYRAQALTNELTREFGRQEKQAELESKQATTDRSKFDLAIDREFKRDDMRSLLESRKAATESTQAGTENTREATRAKRAEFPFIARSQEAQIAAQEASAAEAARRIEKDLLAETKRRNSILTLNQENERIDSLLTKAKNGEKQAYELLMDYSMPYGLEEGAPEEYGKLREKLLLAQKMATDSETRALSEKSRLGYELLAQKLYLDNPAGRPVAAKIVSILKRSPGFLGFEQEEAIQNAFNIYKTQINPSTKLNLPTILDNYSTASKDEKLMLRRDAQEKDRKSLFDPKPTLREKISLFKAASETLGGMGPEIPSDDPTRLEAETVLRSISQDPQIADPAMRQRLLIEKMRLQNTPVKQNNKKQDVQKANLQNLEIYQ